ncbi:MAG: hypothetical protein AAGG38_14650 [Planctomycetota bacterium]
MRRLALLGLFCVAVVSVILVTVEGFRASGAIAQAADTGVTDAGSAEALADVSEAKYSAESRKQRESIKQRRELEKRLSRGDGSARQALRELSPTYDRAGFRKNPEAYLSVADPGRIDDVLTSEDAEYRLEAIGRRSFEIESGKSATLRVKTAPKAPVTFLAYDGGAFINGLSTITVQADRRGRASARFIAAPGMVASGGVEAASPEASGRVNFTIYVPYEED